MSNEAAFITSATHRKGYPHHNRIEVALAGRSNVGKSSLINTITGKKGLARTAKKPGRTRTLNFYAFSPKIALVDLPGYGYAEVSEAMRRSWAPMIENYLAERDLLKGVFLIIDGRHGPTQDDLDFWDWLQRSGLNYFAIASKWDKVKSSERHRRLKQMQEALGQKPVLFSAVTGQGKDDVTKLLLHILSGSGGTS